MNIPRRSPQASRRRSFLGGGGGSIRPWSLLSLSLGWIAMLTLIDGDLPAWHYIYMTIRRARRPPSKRASASSTYHVSRDWLDARPGLDFLGFSFHTGARSHLSIARERCAQGWVFRIPHTSRFPICPGSVDSHPQFFAWGRGHHGIEALGRWRCV